MSGGSCSCGKDDCGSPGKHPRTANGLKDGTTDAATIRRWCKRWPSANVAICTGPESGMWMLGPDGQAGIDALNNLVREHGELPATPIARSGSGGRHYLFRWPMGGKIGNRKNHRGVPIDLRGDAGSIRPHLSNRDGGVGRKASQVYEVNPDVGRADRQPGEEG